MIISISDVLSRREAALFDAVKKIEPELRLIDPLCYATHLVFGQLPEVHDQIVGILERNFKNYSMSFSCTGDVQSAWDKAPSISLDFEFNFNGVFAFFRFCLSKNTSKVELHHISFEKYDATPEQNSTLLETSLRQAMFK